MGQLLAGPVGVETPRDRAGTFQPRLVPKGVPPVGGIRFNCVHERAFQDSASRQPLTVIGRLGDRARGSARAAPERVRSHVVAVMLRSIVRNRRRGQR